MPTLSVFMTNYNHAAELPRALDALLSQSRPAEQIVVVDDGSTDGSWAVLKRYAGRHPSLELRRHDTNRGVSAGIATALEACTGDWVYGAGSDDEVLPGFFEAAMRQAAAYPTAGVVLGDVVAVYDDHRGEEVQRIARWSAAAPQFVTPERFAQEHLAVDCCGFSLGAGTIYRRDALHEVGGFREALGSWCDTFAGRALALRHGAVYLGRTATRWTATHRSYSHRSGDDAAHMQAIGQTAAALMRDEFADLYDEADVRRFETRWTLEMAGGYERVSDTLVPRRLRDVRRAYAELSRDGRWFDRVLGGLLRAMFACCDRRREAAASCENWSNRKPTQVAKPPEDPGLLTGSAEPSRVVP
ncbi:MAG: glycosyltransferase family 2 protein [Planctomycetota bacterium]